MTKIEWCDITLNPIVGCSHCSPGCDHCYAEKFAQRLAKNPKTANKYAGVVDENGWTGRISKLDMSCFGKLPKKPSRIFVGSMTDFFHENANFDDQGEVLNRIAHTPEHTFLLLTKRPELAYKRYHTPLPNVWLGVTVCNQEEADEKIPPLMKIPAAKRFVSVQPMLGPVDLHGIYSDEAKNPSQICGTPWGHNVSVLNGMINYGTCFSGRVEYEILDWVICQGNRMNKTNLLKILDI